MAATNSKKWLVFALLTTALWGIWGAFAGLPAEFGFPPTLIYVVWALTMLVPAAFAWRLMDGKLPLDATSIFFGCAVGLLGAGGQMLLFYCLTIGPAYLIFPIISLSPVLTVCMSLAILRERTGVLGAVGIFLALLALPLFEISGTNGSASGVAWFLFALLVLLAWGLQAFFIKIANQSMPAESIFIYMTITGLALIPLALWMTDFSVQIEWGIKGPWLAAGTQILNAIGALCLVYAFRYGKAIIVSPLTNAGAPLITAVIALVLLEVIPSSTKTAGIVMALIATVLLAIATEKKASPEQV